MSTDWGDPTYFGGAPSSPGAPTSGGSSIRDEVRPADHWSEPSYHGRRKHRPGGHAAPAAMADQPMVGDQDVMAEQIAVTDGEPPVQAVAVDVEQPPTNTATATAAPGLLASSRTMAIASLASRATGFLRTMAIAAALGTGANRIADAYNLANTLPNMVYELLLGGVLTSVIVPVLVKAQHDDDDAGQAYTQRLLSIATVVLAGATLIAVLAAPLLIAVFGAKASYRDLSVLWATLLLPEIFFYGLGAMFAAVLNTRHVYGWPAWAPVLNNLITIVSVGLFLLVPGPSSLTTASITNTQVVVLGLGTTLGIVAQAVVLIAPLRASGFRWAWRFRARPNETGRMTEFRTLAQWVLAYVAISQVGVFAINRVANQHRGGVTTFANADLLFQVPYGILGVSLLTALMPRMSRSAALGDDEELLEDFRLGARLSAVALLPISLGLMVLGPSLTSVIFLGRFDLTGARLVGIALAAGAFGLFPFALVMLQQRVFYALRDARTPTLINLAMVGVKVACLVVAASVLHGRSVIIALTVSTSLSYVAGCVAGHVLLRRRFGLIRFGLIRRTILAILKAAVAGAVVSLLCQAAVTTMLGIGRVSALLALILGGAGGLAAAGAVALRLDLPEVTYIRRAVLRRGEEPTAAEAVVQETELPDESADEQGEIVRRLRGD